MFILIIYLLIWSCVYFFSFKEIVFLPEWNNQMNSCLSQSSRTERIA